jgi:hypothetical protein
MPKFLGQPGFDNEQDYRSRQPDCIHTPTDNTITLGDVSQAVVELAEVLQEDLFMLLFGGSDRLGNPTFTAQVVCEHGKLVCEFDDLTAGFYLLHNAKATVVAAHKDGE